MTALSSLVERAADSCSVTFGPAGAPVKVSQLIAAGARRYGPGGDGEAVGILMTNEQGIVECLFGAIARGVTLVSLPLPPPRTDPAEYVSWLAGTCQTLDIEEVIANDAACALLEGVGIRARSYASPGGRPLASPGGGGFRLVQFSSGTTGPPRAVALDDQALGANVLAILRRIDPRPGDTAVSWLPLAHDMGLVGMLLASIAGMAPGMAEGGDLLLLDPTRFMRSPGTWLTALTERRATITATPGFGLRLATRQPLPGRVDLSDLRCVIVGGEVVRADTLRAFTEACAPMGLGEGVLCPAYGMAELGVAATMTPAGEPWRTRWLSAAGLADGELAGPRPGERAVELVAAGPPLDGYQVTTAVDRARATGRVVVRGPSVGADGFTGRSLCGEDGTLVTGDEGFVEDRWLYVAGRADDYLVAHGRNLYAPAIEAAIGGCSGVRCGRVAAISLPTGAWSVIAEVADAVRGDTGAQDRIRADVGRAAVGVTSARPDDIILVPPGTIPITTSGKVRRARLRSQILGGSPHDAAG